MCLSVTHVPTSKKAARCVKSKKEIYGDVGNWYTPYQSASPREGWLACDRAKNTCVGKSMWTEEVYYGMSIGPGVHSHEREEHGYKFYKDAYSIGVAAYNECYEGEVVSGMLYIPECGTPNMARLVRVFYKSPTKTNFKKIMAELPEDKEIRGAAKRVLARFF